LTAKTKLHIQCLLDALSYYRREGTTSLPRWRRGTLILCERLFVRSPTQTNQKAHLVPFHPTTTTPTSNRRSLLRNDEAYSLSLYRRQWKPLPHGPWSCSSKPWTGRTGQAEGRFSYWNHWRYSLYHRNTPTTGQGLVSPTTCLVGHPPIH